MAPGPEILPEPDQHEIICRKILGCESDPLPIGPDRMGDQLIQVRQATSAFLNSGFVSDQWE